MLSIYSAVYTQYNVPLQAFQLVAFEFVGSALRNLGFPKGIRLCKLAMLHHCKGFNVRDVLSEVKGGGSGTSHSNL